jgi:hypothetical protein
MSRRRLADWKGWKLLGVQGGSSCKVYQPVQSFAKGASKGRFGSYVRRTTCNIFAAAAHGRAQDGAIADGADQRSGCWKRCGDVLRGEIARQVLRRITVGAGDARCRDGIVEPDLIRIILHESQMALSTCCRRCESSADGGHVG